MHGFLIRSVVNAVALWLTSLLFDGIYAESALVFVAAALVLGFLNALLRPLLLILTLPINVLMLGLFTFVINGFLLHLTGQLVPGFHVHGLWTSILGALMLSVFSFLLSLFLSDRGRVEYVYVERRIED